MSQWFLFMVNGMSTGFAKLFASVGNSNKVRIKFKTVEVRGTTFKGKCVIAKKMIKISTHKIYGQLEWCGGLNI